MDNQKLANVSSWVLAILAVVSTVFVVYLLVVPNSIKPAKAGPQNLEATYIEGWKDALAVGYRVGPSNAPVQVIEFADLECPYCAQYEAVVKAVLDQHPTQVAFNYAILPLPMHANSEPAARAVECANVAGRFNEMRTLIFQRQQELHLKPWAELAEDANVSNVDLFSECLDDPRTVTKIQEAKEIALSLGVRGTPTIYINGWKMPGPPSPKQFETIVENVAKGRQPALDVDWE